MITDEQRFSRKEFVRVGMGSIVGLVLGACGRPGKSTAQRETASAAGGLAHPETTAGAATGALPDTTRAPQPFVNGVEALRYTNPFGQKLAPVWIDGKKAFHLNLGATNQKPPYKIAEQYLVLRESAYTSPTRTPAEFMAMAKMIVGDPVFDSHPGQAEYSPIWHNNWVLVPQSYQSNTFKSEQDVKKSGYRIVSTPIWVN